MINLHHLSVSLQTSRLDASGLDTYLCSMGIINQSIWYYRWESVGLQYKCQFSLSQRKQTQNIQCKFEPLSSSVYFFNLLFSSLVGPCFSSFLPSFLSFFPSFFLFLYFFLFLFFSCLSTFPWLHFASLSYFLPFTCALPKSLLPRCRLEKAEL